MKRKRKISQTLIIVDNVFYKKTLVKIINCWQCFIYEKTIKNLKEIIIYNALSRYKMKMERKTSKNK